MKLYVDSSVLLRVALAEKPALKEWPSSKRWYSSDLLRLECFRTIDRARIRLGLVDAEVAERRSLVHELLRHFDFVRLDAEILARAAEPFPTALGSLDAIHLASALAAQREVPDLRLATHDRELAIAARAVGFDVIGYSETA